MRLLFDQNLSPRLVAPLAGPFPDARHDSTAGLDTASDEEVWSYARDNEYVIVTKDSAFGDMCVLCGFLPKVLWTRLGNCHRSRVKAGLRANRDAIVTWGTDPTFGTLELK